MDKRKKGAFSKRLLVQESVLIWILTFSFIGLAYLCVRTGYTGTLLAVRHPDGGRGGLTGVSQGRMYYKKSEKENTAGGIVFETAMKQTTKRDC